MGRPLHPVVNLQNVTYKASLCVFSQTVFLKWKMVPDPKVLLLILVKCSKNQDLM